MTVLERIFQEKRMALRSRMETVGLDEMRLRARDGEPSRGFLRSLQASTNDIALIAEVKKASPSRGIIREDFDPASIARTYEEAGADCLSVLTDRKDFMGDPSYVQVCREASRLPVLRKDFVVDEYDVYEARALGADAILLIVAMLEEENVLEWIALAKSLDMDALVEVHTPHEAEIALRTGATLIGINNRDLHSFAEDLATTEAIAPMLGSDTTIVSESAIHSRDDLERVQAAGVSAALIGTAFMASDDISESVREVMGWQP